MLGWDVKLEIYGLKAYSQIITVIICNYSLQLVADYSGRQEPDEHRGVTFL